MLLPRAAGDRLIQNTLPAAGVQLDLQGRNWLQFIQYFVGFRVLAVFHGVGVFAAVPPYIIQQLPGVCKRLILKQIAIICYELPGLAASGRAAAVCSTVRIPVIMAVLASCQYGNGEE